MKINYLEDSTKNQPSKLEKKVVKFQEPTFYLSEIDYKIFREYDYLHIEAYGHTFIPNGHIFHLLKDRKNIKALNITQQESSSNRHMDFNYGEDLYKELVEEAKKLKIDINYYIRGIVYSRTMELMEEKRRKEKEIEEWREDNRVINFHFSIEKDLRKKLEKKYGMRIDDEYVDLVYKIINDSVGENNKKKGNEN